ncbi:MAG: hypothetical protein QOF61_1523 [Acidobacteriota bacterium]|jgi:predicted permease|nr:hypothetical protein [Acidobacteriota bacterium]
MEAILRDLRYGLRALRNNPGFTLIALLSLALGIGANTAIFSVAHAVFLRPLAVEDPASLVAITNNVLSYPDYLALRDRNHVCRGLAAFSFRELSLEHGGQPERVAGVAATGNYFDVLGVRAATGRTFLPEDDAGADSQPVVVLSHQLWRARFGGDREVVGKTLRLNGVTFTVVGVAPPSFRGTSLVSKPDLWVPLTIWPRLATGYYTKLDIKRRTWSWLSVFGRLESGVARERAESELNQLAQQERDANHAKTQPGFHYEMRPLTVAATGMDSRQDFVRFMTMLFAVVGVALLLACANVANLLLARATARRREIGVRLALGASRSRLVRQLLAESVMLSLMGGAAGLLVALWSLELLSSFDLPGGIALGKLDLGLQPGVLAFTFLLSLATGVVFGLAPALGASKLDLIATLKNQAASVTPGHARLRHALVATQVALCLLLLICAGLFLRSLRNALSINIGFEPERVATASVNLGLQRYDAPRARAFYDQLAERLVTTPGVQSAAWATTLPLSGGRDRDGMELEGYQPPEGQHTDIDSNAVSPGYFRTLGIPVLRGRDFDARDNMEAPGAAMVNEALARAYWHGQDPLGKRIKDNGREVFVVGVVRDHKFIDLRTDPPPQVFFPLAQVTEEWGLTTVSLVARTDGEPTKLFGTIEREAHGLDPALPVFNLRPLGDNLREQLTAQRFGGALLGLFSLLALALASVGIYGVVAYSVVQRTREFGIRIALGAQARDILRLVLGRGSLPIAAGLALGLISGVVLTRFLSSFFYDLSTTDPLTFAAAATLLAAIALAACLIPARRATRVDPMIALRDE